MILHTTVPHELIFPTEQNEFSKQLTLSWNGIPVLVEQVENKYKVIRVLSSNPSDFLLEEICPGQLISIVE